jgi:hypothetical protein
VAPTVTLAGPAEHTQLFTGLRNRTTFSGTVSPADAGARIVLQRENATANEEWHAIQRGIVGPGGSYSLTHTFVIPGDANIRVVVRPFWRFTVRGVSSPLSYDISQKENPALTLSASADPIAYGGSVTLTGVVAGGAGKEVTLYSHIKGAAAAPLAKATAGPTGAYTFTQVPMSDTAYQVRSATGVKSAVVFEGVKYVLTASVSAPSVQAGQTLTFSGTVAPARTGHVIYLERENAFGGGFHVVDVSTVTAAGTYVITHPVFGSGKEVFRVKIPGDPLNQGVSSQLFSEEVTPAVPGTLRPLAPSKLPVEGQI